MDNKSKNIIILPEHKNELVNAGTYIDDNGYFIKALPTMENQKYSKVYLYKWMHTKKDVLETRSNVNVSVAFKNMYEVLDDYKKDQEAVKPKNKIQDHFMVDKHWAYEPFVFNFLSRHFKELKEYEHTLSVLKGLSIFLDYTEKESVHINTIDNIDSNLCSEVMGNLISVYDYEDMDSSSLVKFINVVEDLTDKNIISNRFKRKSKKTKQITTKNESVTPSSSIIFQLNYFAKKEINFTIKELTRINKNPLDGVFIKTNHSSYENNRTQEELIKLSCFDLHMIYPFVLYFLLNYGINIETLKSWKVIKNNKGYYEPLADNVGLFMVIEGIKKRSNSVITSVITKKSKDWDILLFLTKFLTPLYSESDTNSLFQFYNCNAHKKIMKIEPTYFTSVKQSSFKYKFFEKYEIYNSNGDRIYSIQHKLLRKAHNYQDFLKGKQEFERQLRKAHKSGDTTKIFYEDQNLEWADAKKHKIAIAQNLLVGIFKGEINREDNKTVKLFAGAMADCKNNKAPTYDNAPELKNNQVCSDWTKCLTQCEQSCVIPKIHGSVIFAWIDYMEDARKDFYKEQDWEKEYLIDYQAAKNTIEYFTDSEKKYAKSNSYKHKDFVRMKFSRTLKIKEEQHA